MQTYNDHAKQSKSKREREIPYNIYMYTLNYDTNELIDIENRLVVAKGEGREGWSGSLGQADANYHI